MALGCRVGEPWTRQMLRKSYQLIGEVSRHVAVVEAVMRTATEAASGTMRRRCMVAAALMGVSSAPALAQAIAFDGAYHADSLHDIRTAVLVTALVDTAQVGPCLARLARWDRERRYADLRRRMSARARRGAWLSIAAG